MASSYNSSKLSNCDKVKQELEKAGINGPGAVLQVSEYGLLRIGSLGLQEVDWLSSNAASSLLKPGYMTALEAEQQIEKWRCLSTGCNLLDEVLGGGFPLRGISEIAGESGCGKSQLCLQLCLSVQYPKSIGGLNAGAVYICTEDSFPTKRLQQLFQTHPKRRFSPGGGHCDLPNFGDNIFIEHIADVAGMRQCVLGRLPTLLSQRSVGLIVVDSVAGVFRASYENNEMKNRAHDMRTVGGQLHKIATQFKVCVICVNQVSGAPSALEGPNRCVPALGLAWSNMVTTRVQLHRLEPAGVDSAPLRSLEVVFAPNLPQVSVPYTVTDAGVFGLA